MDKRPDRKTTAIAALPGWFSFIRVLRPFSARFCFSLLFPMFCFPRRRSAVSARSALVYRAEVSRTRKQTTPSSDQQGGTTYPGARLLGRSVPFCLCAAVSSASARCVLPGLRSPFCLSASVQFASPGRLPMQKQPHTFET